MTKRIGGRLLLGLALLVPHQAATAGDASTAPPTYQVEVLGDFTPRAINEAGDVAGWQGWPTEAVVYRDATGLTQLPSLPSAGAAEAWDLNDQGQVVGTSGGRAVLWTNGAIQDLGTLEPQNGSASSEGSGLNDLGHVVGSSTANQGQHPFFWSPETGMIDLTPEVSGWGYVAYAEDINESDRVTGTKTSTAFRWQAGTLESLGAPAGYAYSFGYAINDAGQVGGMVKELQTGVEKVARYTDGVGWEVLGGGGQDNKGFGINADGTVVGEAWIDGPTTEGVVYIDGHGLLGLDDLAPDSDYGFKSAWDINDAGQIVAFGFHKVTGEGAALRLTPSGSEPPPPSGDHTLTVTRDGAGRGKVTSSPAGIDCGSDCTEAYASGTSVTLSARAASDSTFAGWSGDCSGTSLTCTLTMDAARSVTATFTTGSTEPPPPSGTYTLTVTKAGDGTGNVGSNPAGIKCGSDCTEDYAAGTSVTLTAKVASGTTFAGWSGDCSGTASTCTVTMDAARSVTATFTTGSTEPPPPSGDTHTLTVTREGAGRGRVTSSPAGITCGTDCSEAYASGTQVTLTAQAASGSAFTGWSGACSGTATTCTVTMDAAKTATAMFA